MKDLKKRNSRIETWITVNGIQVFYINDECGLQQNLTNDNSFPMIKASQI